MANTRVLVVAAAFALLQVIALHIPEVSADCHISGYLTGRSGDCNPDDGSECCVHGKKYPQYRCSPPVSARTAATLTLNSFEAGGHGGERSSCDGAFHKNTEMVVALSSGWLLFDGKRRCNKIIRITGNGRTVLAKVVDECDTVHGCDSDHNFEPPCRNNIVDGALAVWKALGLDTDVGEYGIMWSDATPLSSASRASGARATDPNS